MTQENKKIVFLGNDSGDEEIYINLEDNKLTGWSLMGLRPETEDTLRERQRDTEISEFYNIPSHLENYIDHERWADDMEEEWLEHHDSQGEYTKDGETYYLGFGSGTDIFHHFESNNINKYEDLVELWDSVAITEKQFNDLLKIMVWYKKDKVKGYKEFMIWQLNVSEYPEGCTE